MRLAIVEYMGKAHYLSRKIVEAGHFLTPYPEHADAVLVDYPTGWGGQKLQLAQEAHERGIPVFSYPHGAYPLIEYDGLTPPCPYLTAELVHGQGHKEVYESFGYPVPTVVIGWSYTKLVPFKPPKRIERILFAPRHPATINQETPYHGALATNRHAYRELLKHPAPYKRLRMLGDHKANGTWEQDGIDTHRLNPVDLYLNQQMLADIHWADLVIAEGTFALLAMAQGKPVVMISQGPATADWTDETVHHYDTYKDMLHYPFSLDEQPLLELAEQARVGGPDVDDWKTRFVGEPLNVDALTEVLEGSLVG